MVYFWRQNLTVLRLTKCRSFDYAHAPQSSQLAFVYATRILLPLAQANIVFDDLSSETH